MCEDGARFGRQRLAKLQDIQGIVTSPWRCGYGKTDTTR